VLNSPVHKQRKSRIGEATLIAIAFLAIAIFPGTAESSESLVSLLGSDGYESFTTQGTSKPEKISRRWTRSAKEIDQLLSDGEWADAAERSDALIADMHKALASGGRSWLGAATTLRAVAQAGLGKKKNALWDRSVALSLFPKSRKADLSSYGKAGRIVGEIEKPFEQDEKGPEVHAIGGQVQSPERIDTPRPNFPGGAQRPAFRLAVQVVVDIHGRTSEPRALHADGPVSFAFLALDTIRDWRFEASTLDGQPIDTLYTTTISGN